MKISTRMLAMALAANVRKTGFSTDETKSRLFLAQWLWRYPTGVAQKKTATKMLALPDAPDERWPAVLPPQQELEWVLRMELQELEKDDATDSVRRMLRLRRVAWYSRLLSARIEHDLAAVVKQVEDSGDTEPFYKHTVAAPGKDRRYVKSPGRVPHQPQQAEIQK